MPTLKLSDTSLYYEISGKKGAPAIIFSPGLSGSGAYWKPQVEEFSSDHAVVIYDHRGCGRSGKYDGTTSVRQMADDVLSIADALGLTRFHLVGQSTGGAIGQVLAAENSDRLLSTVIGSSWARPDGYMRWAFELRTNLLRDVGPAAYVHASPLFLYPSWWFRDHEQSVRTEIVGALNAFPGVQTMQNRIDAIMAFDGVAALGGIRVPVLVTGARDDGLTPHYHSEQIAKGIPGARLKIFDTGGHSVSKTQPEAFNRVVREFFQSLSK